MAYKIQLTEDAEQNLDSYIRYLLFVKKSEQAAGNLLDDFEATKRSLELVAGSLSYCENLRLKELGYKKISFLSHRYFMLFRIQGNVAIVDNIFHELQDFEHKML